MKLSLKEFLKHYWLLIFGIIVDPHGWNSEMEKEYKKFCICPEKYNG